MLAAWREFKRGKSQKQDIQLFELNLEDNLFTLHEQLKNKTYRHGPYKSFFVRDPKLRHIHKAQVRDRVAHQALYRVLYQVFNPSFIFDSYSCRVDKGTHAGVWRLDKLARKESRNFNQKLFALKCDVRKFFDNVDHETLTDLVKRKVGDQDALWLIELILKSFEKTPRCGLPLGNVTSQLFGNIYLNELDQLMKHKLKIKYYIRYCDDFVILSKDEQELRRLIFLVGDFLQSYLKLKLHPNKITVRKYRQGVDFLGYVSRPHYRVIRTTTKRRIIRRVNQSNLQSYLGVCFHAHAKSIERAITLKVL